MTTLKTSPCLRSKAYLEWVRRRDCLTPGGCDGDVVAHHVRLGQNGGTGLKPSDYRSVPLCDRHHKELHQVGEKTFERRLWRLEDHSFEWAIRTLLSDYAHDNSVEGSLIVGMEWALNQVGL